MNDTPPPSPNPQPPPPPYPPYLYPPYQVVEDEINLLDYWRVLVRYKVMIISITLLATIAAVTVAFLMTPIYRAEVLLAPASDDEQNSMSALASQFGGLASLAGINLGSIGSNTDQVLATLSSRIFIGDFIVDKQLMQVLFADKWDASAKTWNVKSSSDVPTALDAYELFNKDILDVSSDKKTGLVTLAVEWRDPEQAALWANELVSRINHHEKEIAVKEAEQSIAYLKEQLAKTSVVEMQQAIYQLMEAQAKKIMLANVRDQYAFKIIDPAVVPEKKIKPKRKVFFVVGFVVGLALSIFIAFVRSESRRREDRYNGITEAAP